MIKTYILDINSCSFIMCEQPKTVIERLEQAVLRNHRIVVSPITYAEMRLGAVGKKASSRHCLLIDAFCTRLNAIPSWDLAVVDATIDIMTTLAAAGR